MGFFTAQTKGFQTTGLNFSELKTELDQQVKSKKLGQDAQLRWTAGKGLYAKDRTWNLSGRAWGGSSVVLRGNKYLAAHREIARAINLGYAFRMHEGQPVGDYIVDKLVTKRAREAMGAKDDDIVDLAQLEKTKRNIYLKASDLNAIQREIKDIMSSGRLLPIQEQHYPELVSSIGYMGGRPEPGDGIRKNTKNLLTAADGRGTKILLEAVARDLLDHKRSRTDPQTFADNREQYEREAKAGARSLLEHQGMTTVFLPDEDNKEDDWGVNPEPAGHDIDYLKGGLSAENARRLSFLLHREGVADLHVQALFQATDLPRHINACSGRVLRLGAKLEAVASELNSREIFNQLTDDIGVKAAENLTYELGEVKRNIEEAIRDNQEIIHDLKKMSYPDDVANSTLRQRKYNNLIDNVRAIDRAMARLQDVKRGGGRAIDDAAGQPIADLIDETQKFCIETLELASGLCPVLSAGGRGGNAPRPLNVRLPGLMSCRWAGNIDFMIETGLKHDVAAPDILFEADSMGRSNVRTLTKNHNARIREIFHNRQDYLRLFDRRLETLSNDEKNFVNSFRYNIVKALRDNESLTEVIERRQKILNEHQDAQIDDQRRRAADQRHALLLLLYPRLARNENGAAAAFQGWGGTEDAARLDLDSDFYESEPVSDVTLSEVESSLLNSFNNSDDAGIERRGDLAGKAVLEELPPEADVMNAPARQRFDVVNDPENVLIQENRPNAYIYWQGAEQDYMAMKDVYLEDYEWLDRILDDTFRKVDVPNNDRGRIGDAVKKVVDQHKSHINDMKRAIDRKRLVDDRERKAVAKKLWTSFGDLVDLKQKLKSFETEQKRRLSSGELKKYGPEYNAANIAISRIKTTQESIDKLMLNTYSAAYALSSRAERDAVQSGAEYYPEPAVMGVAPATLRGDDYAVTNAGHALTDYAHNKAWGDYGNHYQKNYLQNHRFAKDYLDLLKGVKDALGTLEESESDADRQKRSKFINTKLILCLDDALAQNTEIMEMFQDRDFRTALQHEQVLDRKEIEAVLKNLAQDRRRIANLRLGAYTVLRRDALLQAAA